MNSWTGCRLGVTTVLLVVCLFLIVGAVWARYQTNLSEYIDYEAKGVPEVFLWSGVSADGDFLSDPGQWSMETGQPTLDFCVSNGKNDADYAAADMDVSIRLIASLGYNMAEEEGSETTVYLKLSDENSVLNQYVGTARKIVEGSPIYAAAGAGWVISFLDEQGEEVKWTLDGGNLSVLQGELVVENMDLQTASMLTLQVSGDFAG